MIGIVSTSGSATAIVADSAQVVEISHNAVLPVAALVGKHIESAAHFGIGAFIVCRPLCPLGDEAQHGRVAVVLLGQGKIIVVGQDTRFHQFQRVGVYGVRIGSRIGAHGLFKVNSNRCFLPVEVRPNAGLRRFQGLFCFQQVGFCNLPPQFVFAPICFLLPCLGGVIVLLCFLQVGVSGTKFITCRLESGVKFFAYWLYWLIVFLLSMVAE